MCRVLLLRLFSSKKSYLTPIFFLLVLLLLASNWASGAAPDLIQLVIWYWSETILLTFNLFNSGVFLNHSKNHFYTGPFSILITLVLSLTSTLTISLNCAVFLHCFLMTKTVLLCCDQINAVYLVLSRSNLMCFLRSVVVALLLLNKTNEWMNEWGI